MISSLRLVVGVLDSARGRWRCAFESTRKRVRCDWERKIVDGESFELQKIVKLNLPYISGSWRAVRDFDIAASFWILLVP